MVKIRIHVLLQQEPLFKNWILGCSNCNQAHSGQDRSNSNSLNLKRHSEFPILQY